MTTETILVSDVGQSGIRDVLDYALDPDRVLVEENHPILKLIPPAQFDVSQAKRWIAVDRQLIRTLSSATPADLASAGDGAA